MARLLHHRLRIHLPCIEEDPELPVMDMQFIADAKRKAAHAAFDA
jgi:hypothetical protein